MAVIVRPLKTSSHSPSFDDRPRCLPFRTAVADLRTFLAGDLAAGWVRYFAPYERVHRNNVARVLGRARDRRGAEA